jgi:hypothetical protein
LRRTRAIPSPLDAFVTSATDPGATPDGQVRALARRRPPICSRGTVPWAIANAAYKRRKHNESVTEITRIPNRGHSLTIDSVWREVAQTALAFVKRSV